MMKLNLSQRVLRLLTGLFKPSLRTKVALVFILPILILVFLLSFDHYTRDRDTLLTQVRLNSAQLGNVVLGGLRQLMLVNDRHSIAASLVDIGRQDNIKRVWIIDLNNEVKESSNPGEIGMKLDVDAAGCIECHQYSAASMPLVTESTQSPGVLRVAAPIDNLPECQACHSAADHHLGVLLVDASMLDTEARLQGDLSRDLVLTLIIILVGMFSSLALVNYLFIRRVSVIHRAIAAFEDGDFSARIERNWNTEDELTQLAESFNGMADSIVDHERNLHELASVRQHAIIEERERIARELHDGVAQFIGYVNIKLGAARLFIKKGQPVKADENLAQIEKEVQNQSQDVRASILGLRIASQSGSGLANSLREYIDQCNRMSDFVIELEIDPQLASITLDAETELQLMRVVQEALSNVRKHASANSAHVRLAMENEALLVAVHDDGVGFNPWTWHGDQQAHFGLQTMRERAEMVGAKVTIESEPGRGTTVTVRLALDEKMYG